MDEFYDKWQEEPQCAMEWLLLKAGSNAPGNVSAVRELTKHPAFINNPSNCYFLYMAFCSSLPNFHAEDGSGYKFLADSIIEVPFPAFDLSIWKDQIIVETNPRRVDIRSQKGHGPYMAFHARIYVLLGRHEPWHR